MSSLNTLQWDAISKHVFVNSLQRRIESTGEQHATMVWTCIPYPLAHFCISFCHRKRANINRGSCSPKTESLRIVQGVLKVSSWIMIPEKSSKKQKRTDPSSEGHPAADLENCVLFSNHLSKPVAFQQSSVPKLLVAGPEPLVVILY